MTFCMNAHAEVFMQWSSGKEIEKKIEISRDQEVQDQFILVKTFSA